MRRLTAVLVGMAVVAAGACSSPEPNRRAAPGSTTSAAPTTTTGAVEVGLRSGPYPAQNLVVFENCADVLAWAHTEAIKTGAVSWMRHGPLVRGDTAAGMAGRSSASAGAAEGAAVAAAPGNQSTLAGTGGDTSSTNNQEVDVDEADFVKTDGKVLVAVAGKFLRVAVRDGAAWRKAGKLELPGEGGEVLLVGKRALVLQSFTEPVDLAKGEYRMRALLIVIDLTDPQRPVVADRYDVDGHVQTARLIGDRVHVVVTTEPQMRFNPVPVEGESSFEKRQQIYKAAADDAIRRTTIDQWVPTGRHFNGKSTPGRDGPAVPCRSVSRPAEFGGSTTVSVLSLRPLVSARPTATASVVGVAAQNVYVSSSAVYVTSHRYLADPGAEVGAPSTDVHRFELTSSDGAKYQGSGRIAGYLRDRYSMSEHEGVLRVVASNGWGDTSQTSVFTYKPQLDVLAPLGSVAGIGVAEQVQSVRFIGDLAYVVTFRQIDPLHVIDLRDPAKPRLRGELKVPGFSSYLHPVSENRLLGVGHSATNEGRTTGLQLALFDISNPDDPREVKTIPVPGQHTEVDNDPRAFLWWAAKSLATFPVMDFPSDGREGQAHEPSMNVVGYRVSSDNLTEVGRLPQRMGQNGWGGVIRSIVSGPTLLTVSHAGVQTSGLESFAETGWLDFASW